MLWGITRQHGNSGRVLKVQSNEESVINVLVSGAIRTVAFVATDDIPDPFTRFADVVRQNNMLKLTTMGYFERPGSVFTILEQPQISGNARWISK
jgi:hypothetical protein